MDQFHQYIETLQQRLVELHQQANGSAHREELVAEALEELSTSSEEINVVVEELVQQNQELEEAQRAVIAERHRYQELFEFAPDGYLISGLDGTIWEANRAATDLFNLHQAFLVGKPLTVLTGEKDRKQLHKLLTRLHREEVIRDAELMITPRGRSPVPVAITVAAVRGADGKAVSLRWLLRDITERKQAEAALQRAHDELERQVAERTAELTQANQALRAEIAERKAYEAQLEQQANYDGLTRLPNRALLQDRLRHAIAHACRNKCRVATLFIDLDRFKTVNDTLGHAAGDALLQDVAERLKICVRQDDTVARLGGDEFVIVLENLSQEDAVTSVAHKVLEAMESPFKMNSHEFFISASIGISLFPRDGTDVPVLLRNADTALYRAKTQGRNRIQFYTASMNTRAVERLTLEQDLRRALRRGELQLYYQPQVSLESNRVTGVEALLRWHHPRRGMVPPAKFIPLAEETGLIVPIGEWVLKRACAQARAWQDAGLPVTRIAVNLSARQLMQKGLADTVARILTETSLAASCLELEITEGLLVQDGGTLATLRALKAKGLGLAIDDFGTGYSSLNYLKRFPIDRLKLARTFVRNITTDPDDAAIALAVIAMAHSLKLKVIAEGVETKAQLTFLRSKRCDEIQGYYFSHPRQPEEMAVLLRERRELDIETDEDDAGQPAVLLVDDEIATRTLLDETLRRKGYRVLTVNDPGEALDLLAGHGVGVVISNQHMPGMDGIEFLKRIRELYPGITRMMVAGLLDKDALFDALNSGLIYRFLSKPVDREMLQTTMREAFLFHGLQSLPNADQAVHG